MTDPIYDLTLTGLAYGGDALGRIAVPGGPERVVFVPFGLPGERVRVRLVEQRRGFARGQLLEVLEASRERIAPRCRHFGACGGCHYQHMPYSLQLKAKADILRDQFRRIGHIADPPIHETVGCSEPWNYRNHVQFHLAPDGKLGYIAAFPPTPRSNDLPPTAVLPISECHLPEPAINGLWPELAFEPGSGIDRVSIRQGADEELQIILESGSPELPGVELEAAISVVHLFDEHSVVLAGRDHITMRLLDRDFQVSAPSFFQVNTLMAGQMVKHVVDEIASLREGRSRQPRNLTPGQGTHRSTDLPGNSYIILEVYCGAGLFSAFLAPHCSRLIGIEASASACEDFTVNLDEFDNVELYEDAAENVLALLDIQPDLVLVDPPRAGLAPAALDGILRLEPQTIVYISCDPSTLARDAARLLKGGYHLLSSTPFDLFPQTYHIESITWFNKGFAA